MKNKKARKTTSIFLDYDFISEISHQMRTPITIIKASVDLLLDEIPGDINNKQRKILTICRSNTKRLIDEMEMILKQLYKKIEERT